MAYRGRGGAFEVDRPLYHGGVAGLGIGGRLVPNPPHVYDGCPICVARAEGREYTVGDMKRDIEFFGDKSQAVMRMLEGEPDEKVIDAPSAVPAVYVTTDYDYARWYAARSRGDLYRIYPLGDLLPSFEDPFETYVVAEAVVAEVLERQVRLDRKDRRELARRWGKADKARKRFFHPLTHQNGVSTR